jgi:hypothetical protein
LGWSLADLYRASFFELTAVLAARMRRAREADEALRKPPIPDEQLDHYFAIRNATLEKQGFKHCA